jgi:uncharacterized membrane protein YdbT with pleckstrin-like domain
MKTLMLAVAMSSGGLGHGLIVLVVSILFIGFLWWVNGNYVPEPMRKWGVLVIVLIVVLALINFVCSLEGRGFIQW